MSITPTARPDLIMFKITPQTLTYIILNFTFRSHVQNQTEQDVITFQISIYLAYHFFQLNCKYSVDH